MERTVRRRIIRSMSSDWMLIDGSSLIFRAFHGVPTGVRTPDGRLANAVMGILDRLARLVADRRPRRIAVASDEDWRPQWRVALLAEYKAHRVAEPVPPALIPQMPVIDAFLGAIGVDVVGAPGYEAEDVIATWTAQAPGTVEIVSGDRDLFALVEDPRVHVLFPERGGYAVVDEAEVTRRYGIPGRSYGDFAILRGDPSDGLPGLRGVGAVGAAQLIRRHGDVATLLRDGNLADRDRDYLERATRVARPASHLEIELPAGCRDVYPADAVTLAALVERHGQRAAADRLVEALATAR
jgi:5'-3' exonuclease